jgi:hypothetical protein
VGVTGRPITHGALVFAQQLSRDRSTAGTFFGADHALFLHAQRALVRHRHKGGLGQRCRFGETRIVLGQVILEGGLTGGTKTNRIKESGIKGE